MSQHVLLGRDEICRLLSRSIKVVDHIRTRGGRLRTADLDSLGRVEFCVATAPELGRYSIRRDDAERLCLLSAKLDSLILPANFHDLSLAYLVVSWMALVPMLLEKPVAILSVLAAPLWAWLVLLHIAVAPLFDFSMGLWMWCLTLAGFAIALSMIHSRKNRGFSAWHIIAACVWLYFGYSTGVVAWLEATCTSEWLSPSGWGFP